MLKNLMTSLFYNTDTNGYHLLSTYYMAGNVLSILHTLFLLVLEAVVWVILSFELVIWS